LGKKIMKKFGIGLRRRLCYKHKLPRMRAERNASLGAVMEAKNGKIWSD
jgi:hypothetical protein